MSNAENLSRLAVALSADNSRNVVQLAQIQTFTASVNGNALTGTYTPSGQITFRNPSLTSGVPVSVVIPAPLSLIVPSGATLGAVNGGPHRLIWLLLYNGGSPVLAIINLTGGNNLDETGLITSVAIGAGSVSSSSAYSTIAVSASPYRVIGFCDVTNSTAGVYASAPSIVQGAGGQAMGAMASLGYGQTVSNPSRSSGVTYYNTTGRPIAVVVGATSSGSGGNIQANVNGFPVGTTGYQGVNGQGFSLFFIVPPGASYFVGIGSSAEIFMWMEMK